ncbi:unnamed protein product [Trichogramma brassicae]|uniref:Uncharacterized protein n=1 Tax=Trichogramma brassicae TaxID=86971 RepID=A0A6H5INE5_9HYME|nr:unnamed protein product [Trichogramma brassicae]
MFPCVLSLRSVERRRGKRHERIRADDGQRVESDLRASHARRLLRRRPGGRSATGQSPWSRRGHRQRQRAKQPEQQLHPGAIGLGRRRRRWWRPGPSRRGPQRRLHPHRHPRAHEERGAARAQAHPRRARRADESHRQSGPHTLDLVQGHQQLRHTGQALPHARGQLALPARRHVDQQGQRHSSFVSIIIIIIFDAFECTRDIRAKIVCILIVINAGSSIDLFPGETGRVRLEIDVPIHAAESQSGIVTLQVKSVEPTEKSAQVFVKLEGKSNYDIYKPLIYYYFNNNCAGRTTGDRCLKSFWSVDVTIQDLNSGLKSVESIPKGIYPRTPYVSGTRGPVHFYYTSNCCNRAFELSAVDTTGNKVIRIIDVNAWYNLMEGEVAAICVGVVLIIVLVALAVVTGLYCAHKRKSHNFSADYGYRTGGGSSRQQTSASPPRE